MDKALIKHIDELIYNEIFVEKVYNLSREEIEGKGILDLGGHYGMFVLFCSPHNPKQIISVEPNHENLHKYIENTVNTNAKVLCAAIDTRKDVITTIDNNGCGSRTGIGNQLVSTISLESLINLFEPNTDLLLKVDIEGAEYDLFYNNNPDLFKKFNTIVVEAHNHNPETKGNEAEQLKQYIESLGYIGMQNGTFWAQGFVEKHNMHPNYSFKFIKK